VADLCERAERVDLFLRTPEPEFLRSRTPPQQKSTVEMRKQPIAAQVKAYR
jgi:hypothetical protein